MMTTSLPVFPHAGETFLVSYGEELAAINAYSEDGKTLRYEITEGPYKGAKAEVAFEWQAAGNDSFLISWQENDKSTVVHHDDFSGNTSNTFFTTPKLDFYRLQGTLTRVP
jgi:hypothetical protein